MTAKGLAVVVVLICSLTMGLAVAQQGATHKRSSPSDRSRPASMSAVKSHVHRQG
jgi:hypothetical protein